MTIRPLKALRSLLRKRHVSTLLISNRINIAYLSGVKLSFGYLLVSAAKAQLFVDGRYTEAAKKTALPGISVRPLKQFSQELKNFRHCAIEADVVTLTQLQNWKRSSKSTKYVHTSGLVEELRRKKMPHELRTFRRSQLLCRKVMKTIPLMLKVGMRESDLADAIWQKARALGAEGLAFETIVGFGSNSSKPHYRAGATKLRSRDIVQIDMGFTVGGFCSDQSRVFFVGAPRVEWQRTYDAVYEAKRAAEKLLKAGVAVKNLDAAARTVFRMRGYKDHDFCHALGHGVGLEIHEAPTLSGKSDDVLQSGDIVTIEPGLYFPGKFGVRLEDEYIVE